MRSVGIHDGAFHADEVTSCALLLLFGLVDREKIIRTRDPQKLAECEFVCDVGGEYDPSRRLFDHHQASYQGGLSSAGMVLLYLFEEKVLTEEVYHYLNQTLILGVDAHDNGRSTQEIGVSTFSHIVASFNPVQYDAPPEAFDTAFGEALAFALGYLTRTYHRFMYNLACQEYVKEVMERADRVLFFERELPWVESFFALGGEKHAALFVVMPSGRQWKLRAIPPDDTHRMGVRLPLPEEWAGLLDKELQRVSGIKGAVFCHKGRFTSVWETEADAKEALRYVLQYHGIITKI